MAVRRILFLAQNLPYPPDGGAKIRTYHTLRELSRGFEITALCFERRKPEYEGDGRGSSAEGLRAFGRVRAFGIPQAGSWGRFLLDHLRAVATRKVYTRYVYDSREYEAALARELAEGSHDLVHADSLDLAGHFAGVRDLPIVCVHHDVQSELLARRAGRDPSAVRRRYIRMQARAMRREEERWCPRVALNVAVSPRDLATLRHVAPDGRYALFPNGVDVSFHRPDPGGGGGGIVFVGGTSWFPNLDALRHFGGEILPRIRARRPDVPVRWVGRATPAEIRDAGRRWGITMTGYVPDIRPYVRAADVCVVPLRVGGGTRIKILDAWAMGLAVVSTSVGCEGLDAAHGENILVADDPEGFAEAVDRALADPGLRRRLGEGARTTVEERYSWERIGEAMRERYRSLAGA